MAEFGLNVQCVLNGKVKLDNCKSIITSTMTPTQIAAKPADKRTPIEQAILNIHLKIDPYGLSHEIYENYAYGKAIEILQALLPAEREAIERAYIYGDEDSSEEQHGGHWSRKHKGSSDYFTQTYGTK